MSTSSVHAPPCGALGHAPSREVAHGRQGLRASGAVGGHRRAGAGAVAGRLGAMGVVGARARPGR
jgi:hypothetical protein